MRKRRSQRRIAQALKEQECIKETLHGGLIGEITGEYLRKLRPDFAATVGSWARTPGSRARLERGRVLPGAITSDGSRPVPSETSKNVLRF